MSIRTRKTVLRRCLQLREKNGFLCEAEGEAQKAGDDSEDVHWAGLDEVRKLIDEKRFSEIDSPAVLMFLCDADKMTW